RSRDFRSRHARRWRWASRSCSCCCTLLPASSCGPLPRWMVLLLFRCVRPTIDPSSFSFFSRRYFMPGLDSFLLLSVAVFFGAFVSGLAGFAFSAVAGAILLHVLQPLEAVPLMM